MLGLMSGLTGLLAPPAPPLSGDRVFVKGLQAGLLLLEEVPLPPLLLFNLSLRLLPLEAEAGEERLLRRRPLLLVLLLHSIRIAECHL